MTNIMTFRIMSRLSRIGGLAQRIRTVAETCGGDEDSLDALEIALVEAVTNIVKHAYGERSDMPIKVTTHLAPDCVVIDIFDAGPEWSPVLVEQLSGGAAAVDVDRLEDLPESGLGLGLIGMSIDTVQYDRRTGVNRLRLAKRLAPPKRAAG